MKIIDCQQGTQEWFAARCGLVTASEVDALVTPKFAIRKGAGVDSYVCKKVAEKLLGWSADMLAPVGSWAMDQGQIVEKIALPWFEFQYNCTVRRVGFCACDSGPYAGRIGCSPDGIVGDSEGLEVKSPQPPKMVEYLLAGVVPEDYLAQIHFSMLVTGFASWRFVAYSRHFDALVVKVARDEAIQATIREAIDGFMGKMDAALAKLGRAA